MTTVTDSCLRRRQAGPTPRGFRLALLAVAAVLAPFVADPFWLIAVNQFLIFAIAVVGLMVLTGFTGQVSLGTGGFLAAGAYTTANLSSRFDLLPAPFGILAGTVVAAALGALFGLPALRLHGLYLAIGTLASQEIILFTVRNSARVTGGVGSMTARHPELGGYTFESDFVWYWVALACLALVLVAVRNLFRTGLGRALIAIRDHEVAAEVNGVDVGRYKVAAFTVAAALAGLSGGIYAHYRQVVTWERYTIVDASVPAVAMIIIGGLGSVAGAVYGAAFITWLQALIERLGQELTDVTWLSGNVNELKTASFGLAIVGFLLFEPRGLARLWRRANARFRSQPFRLSRPAPEARHRHQGGHHATTGRDATGDAAHAAGPGGQRLRRGR